MAKKKRLRAEWVNLDEVFDAAIRLKLDARTVVKERRTIFNRARKRAERA